MFVGARRKVANGPIFWNTLSQNELRFNISGRKVWESKNASKGQKCLYLVTTAEILQEGRYAYRDGVCSGVVFAYICERIPSKCFQLFFFSVRSVGQGNEKR